MADITHILVVDDDDRLRMLLAQFLRKEGYAVSTSANVAEARKFLKLFAFDLLILDVMMPGESGLSFARSQQKKGDAPVLMLSARTETEDRVAGLESGADDYLAKPFEPRELLLRIQVVLRRTRRERTKTGEIAFGEYIFDLQSRQLRNGGGAVRLTTAEAALLAALAEHSGQAVSRERLTELTGQEAGSERSIDVQITRLRRKIEETGKPLYLQTVRGAGYVLHGTLL